MYISDYKKFKFFGFFMNIIYNKKGKDCGI